MSHSAAPGPEQAGELKFGQVGIANLRVRDWDIDRLVAEMRERVERAPQLFARAAVIVDVGSLARCPDAQAMTALLSGLRRAGVYPVALGFGTSQIDALSREIELPLLAKFRARYESTTPRAEPSAAEAAPAPPSPPAERSAVDEARRPRAAGQVHTTPIRSGQQVYASECDLTVCAMVSAGAEVIADGSIHVYGALRGRALAGAQGNEQARIFCREFQAELVAIAGHYKVFDELPVELRGKPVQVWLEGDRLRVAELT